jgi:hypothetical protein
MDTPSRASTSSAVVDGARVVSTNPGPTLSKDVDCPFLSLDLAREQLRRWEDDEADDLLGYRDIGQTSLLALRAPAR